MHCDVLENEPHECHAVERRGAYRSKNQSRVTAQRGDQHLRHVEAQATVPSIYIRVAGIQRAANVARHADKSTPLAARLGETGNDQLVYMA